MEDSEWEVLSSDGSFGEDSGLWFEPHGLVRNNYFALSATSSPKKTDKDEEDEDDDEEDVKEIGIDENPRMLITRSSSPEAEELFAVPAIKFDDMTVTFPADIKIRSVFAPYDAENADLCPFPEPDLKTELLSPDLTQITVLKIEDQVSLENVNENIENPLKIEENAENLKGNVENMENLEKEEDNDENDERVSESDEKKSENEEKITGNGEKKRKMEMEHQPQNPLAALCTFGMAALAMGLFAMTKSVGRGGGGMHKTVDPQILRFHYYSDHQKINELLFHSGRGNRGNRGRGGIPVCFHISFGGFFE